MLRRRGFPAEWVRWVILCVTTNSFSVLVNGRPQGGWFQLQKGIRQGCLLAPQLFILAADALAICTMILISQGYLSSFQTAGSPDGIPLLQYADESTFSIQGSEIAARTFSNMMNIFSNFFGLQLNRAKSIFVGFGLTTDETSRYAKLLETLIGTLPVRYLGLPLADRRLRVQDWQPVLKKVEARLGGWRARMISRGGRLVLVKAVLSAIPTYFMSVFRMPSGVRHQLERTMRRFFWRGTDTTRGGALVAWSMVCRPVAHGRLGIRHLDHTNTALLSKWVIQLESCRDLVSTLLHEQYGHSLDRSIWANPWRGDSPFVASLRGIFPIIRPFCKPQLGDGALFWFWEDDWSGHGQLGAAFPRLYALAPDTTATVRSMWTGTWTPTLHQALFD